MPGICVGAQVRGTSDNTLRLRRLWNEHVHRPFPDTGTDPRLQEVALYASWLGSMVELALRGGGLARTHPGRRGGVFFPPLCCSWPPAPPPPPCRRQPVPPPLAPGRWSPPRTSPTSHPSPIAPAGRLSSRCRSSSTRRTTSRRTRTRSARCS